MHDRGHRVSCTIMEVLRNVSEDGILLIVFDHLGPSARRKIEVARHAVEAYGRLGMWTEADKLTLELRDKYGRTQNSAANTTIARWREIIAEHQH